MRTAVAVTLALASFSPTDHDGLGLDAFEMLVVKGGKFAVLDR